MNTESINDDVFIYRNFLTDIEHELLYSSAKNLKNWDILKYNDVGSFWKKRLIPYEEVENVFKNGDVVKATLSSIRNRILEESQKLTENILFYGPINMNKFSADIKGPSERNEDENNLEMFFHRDDQEKGIDIVDVGSVLYLNDNFSGGEIVYPDLNFSYKPEAKTLVLHRGHVMHGVSKVISGDRYMLTCFLFK